MYAVAAMLATTHACAQLYSISGRVENAKNALALPGATLELAELKIFAVSDEQGQYRLTKIPPGEYTLIARYIGFSEGKQLVTVNADSEADFLLEESYQLTDEVVVESTRANDKTPTTFTQVNKQTIEKQNFGQDLPIVLNWTPSIVTTSDAGAGVGYTGLRIRGSDPTRINVTVNGIALNDSESQGVFWVNTPDLASSIESIQIQRGVGTSTNGAGAFGATVSVQTDALHQNPYAEISASAGSFNTQRYTFKAGTGLINNRWSFDGRISDIRSDGYLQRATSDLNSYYLSGGYYGDKTIVRAIMFGGHERTYQAWYGIDPGTMAVDRTFNYAGAIYDDNGNVARYYDNEVDDYRQDHYQLHLSHQFSNAWNGNISFHYTDGRGFFEQYQQSRNFADLGVGNVTIGDSTISFSDVIVRRWLDNNYYGTTYSLNYEGEKHTLTVGGAYSQYDPARHFGEVIWSAIAAELPIRHIYYDGQSQKKDFNVFAKWSYSLTERLSTFVDLQYRAVNYKTAGIDDDQLPYDVKDRFHFINPKAGLTYTIAQGNSIYLSYAIANREPNRSDYLEGVEKPKSEQLGNLEFGWKRNSKYFGFEVNYYLMNYTDQLVLTGEVSDTGYPIRANIGKSFRTGIEMSGSVQLTKAINWTPNVTWSVNKNRDFAFVNENNESIRKNTAIILSPSWIGGSQLSWKALRNLQIALLSKYVGKQYLDNTENDAVSLEPYLINDIRISYAIPGRTVRRLEFGLLVNNIFDVEYSSNGYGYGGIPYFFPQAGTNLMAMISVRL